MYRNDCTLVHLTAYPSLYKHPKKNYSCSIQKKTAATTTKSILLYFDNLQSIQTHARSWFALHLLCKPAAYVYVTPTCLLYF